MQTPLNAVPYGRIFYLKIMEPTELINSNLTDYGVMGTALILIIYFAWYQYQRDQKNTDEIKKDLRDSNAKFLDLNIRQITIQENQSVLLVQLNKKIDELSNHYQKSAK